MRFVLGLLSTTILSALVLAGCADPDDDAEGDASAGGALTGGTSGNARVSGTGGALNIRSGPSKTSNAIGTVAEGAMIDVKCRATGDAVRGNTGWDFVPKLRGYVSDAYITMVGAAPPACDSSMTASTTSSASSSSATDGTQSDALVTEARKWVGTKETGENCNPFSKALGRPCEAWCADFVQYVWQQTGMNTEGVTAYAGSFLSYGQQFGTLKARDATDVMPGDAVVWAKTATDAAHVGMVSEVLPNGDVKVVNGNYADDVEEKVSARSSVVSGMGIAGFVSPTPLASGAASSQSSTSASQP